MVKIMMAFSPDPISPEWNSEHSGHSGTHTHTHARAQRRLFDYSRFYKTVSHQADLKQLWLGIQIPFPLQQAKTALCLSIDSLVGATNQRFIRALHHPFVTKGWIYQGHYNKYFPCYWSLRLWVHLAWKWRMEDSLKAPSALSTRLFHSVDQTDKTTDPP